MIKYYFLLGILLVIPTVLINLNILYGLSLYIIPLIAYSFVLIIYGVFGDKLGYTGEVGRDLYVIIFTTFILWVFIGFLVGFGLNIMVVLPMQYIIFLVYKTTRAASIEVLRRVLLDRYVGIGFSSAKLLIISIIMLLFSITLSKLITFSISYLPEILVLFINSTVLTTIGYFRGFKSQLVLSILNIFLFSISPILLNVMGAIKYMLESFIIFTQFLVFYYFNTMNADIKHINEYVLLSRFREVIRAMFSILSKIFFVAAIIFMISFLIGFRGLAIVSNSMSPTINRGDLVFIDINDHEVNKGDIIAFTYEDKIILHRVYRVDNQTSTILTKGDANKNIDPWIVTNNNYVGKYVFSIPLLGYPSIFLSSLFTNPVISISLTVILILAFLIIILMKEMV